jgi:hypothetical protein
VTSVYVPVRLPETALRRTATVPTGAGAPSVAFGLVAKAGIVGQVVVVGVDWGKRPWACVYRFAQSR